MKRFWIILAFVLCGSFSTESAVAETHTRETCWSNFWTRYEQIENQIKRSCRECTDRWYADRSQPDYGLTCLANSEPSSHESIVVFVHGFSSKVAALQFEWAWQHPTMSRFLKGSLGHLRVTKSSHSPKIRCAT